MSALIHRMSFHLLSFVRVNWIQTMRANFGLLPIGQAVRLPIVIWGRCRLNLKGGRVELPEKVSRGMVRIGFRFENSYYVEPSDLQIHGCWKIDGTIWVGTAVRLLIEEHAVCRMGHMVNFCSCANITCCENVVLDEYACISSFVELTDSNYHYMEHVADGRIYPLTRPVHIGAYNYICSRAGILPGTVTPPYTTVAFGAVCNKDYTLTVPEKSVIAGVPARLVKEGVSRVFDFEREKMISEYFKNGQTKYFQNNAQP